MGGKSENETETEREAFKNADEYDKDDVSEFDDIPDEQLNWLSAI